MKKYVYKDVQIHANTS